MKIARRVLLTNRMYAFLTATANDDNTLQIAIDSMAVEWRVYNKALIDIWDRWDEACDHKIEGEHDIEAFRVEFNKLVAEWGPDYNIELLL